MDSEIEFKLEITAPYTLLAVRKVAALLKTGLDSLVQEDDAGIIELAVVEACNNLVEHGTNRECHAKLVVTLEIERELVRVLLKDRGKPFDITHPRRQEFDAANVANLPTGGMGLTIIHDIMDEVDYQVVGGVNVTTLVKRVSRILTAPSDPNDPAQVASPVMSGVSAGADSGCKGIS